MSNRSFYLLIASALMLFGAAALSFKRLEPRVEVPSQETFMQAECDEQEGGGLLLPVLGEIEQEYGAVYNEQHGQWFLCEELRIKTKSAQALYAPAIGTVEKIEGIEEEQLFSTGSRIVLKCGRLEITMYPIYGVRVFEGSNVTRQSILGSTGERLSVTVRKDEVTVDPLTVSMDE